MIPCEGEVRKGVERQDVTSAVPTMNERLARYPLSAEPKQMVSLSNRVGARKL